MTKEELDIFIGTPGMSIVDAMIKIDANALGVLFIVDDEERFVGTLSDGDVRRSLIKDGNLNQKVEAAMNSHPISVKVGQEKTAKDKLKRKVITALPVLDEEGRIVDIIDRKGEISHAIYANALADTPIVMMAGGKGTRLYPYTKILPKPLIPVGDKPIAELIIESFLQYGSKDYYLIVNHKKNMIKAYFNETEKDYNVSYVDEEIPLGTGGGLSLLKGKISQTFVLTNCDILIEENYAKILEFHKKQKNKITMVCSLKNFRIPYGIVHMADEGSIASMEEKPTLSFFTNTGCYFVEPEVIDDIPEQTEMGFPDMIERYRKEGKKVGVYPIGENAWLDMGQLDALELMRARLEKRK